MDPRPSRMPWLSPYIAVKNLEKSANFYVKAFGFKIKGMKDHNGHINHINVFHKNTVLFMIHPENSMGSPARSPTTLNISPSQSFYVFVDNVDKIYERAIASGCRSVVFPEDFYWGDRMCTVTDLDGYSWSFAKALKKVASKKKKSTTKKTKVTKSAKAKKVTKKTIKKRKS